MLAGVGDLEPAGKKMRTMNRNLTAIGLISDTHGLLREEALRGLKGSELIIHAGDVGKPEIIDTLKRIAPVVAVRGNVDTEPWAFALPEQSGKRRSATVPTPHNACASRSRANTVESRLRQPVQYIYQGLKRNEGKSAGGPKTNQPSGKL